jgi:methionyl-tRNA formyltransferase
MTSKNVYDLVRAMNGPDLPPAYSFLKIKDETYKIEIIEVEEMGETIVGPYGRVALKRKNGVVVICKDKGILIKKIKLGDEIISATYFLNSGGYTFHKRDE